MTLSAKMGSINGNTPLHNNSQGTTLEWRTNIRCGKTTNGKFIERWKSHYGTTQVNPCTTGQRKYS